MDISIQSEGGGYTYSPQKVEKNFAPVWNDRVGNGVYDQVPPADGFNYKLEKFAKAVQKYASKEPSVFVYESLRDRIERLEY